MATATAPARSVPSAWCSGVEVLGGGQVREVEVAQLDVAVLPLQTTDVTWRPAGSRT